MAASEILAVGTTSATSSDFTVAEGTPVTVGLKGSSGDNASMQASIKVQVKGDGGLYYDIDELSGSGSKALSIIAAGTYRLRRPGGVACGAYRAA